MKLDEFCKKVQSCKHDFSRRSQCGFEGVQDSSLDWIAGFLGNPESDIVFIDESPSFTKDMWKVLIEPDRSAQWSYSKGEMLFRSALEEAGLISGDNPKEWKCWITNLIKCALRPNIFHSREEARKRKETMCRNCARFLIEELNSAEPKLIVLIGKNTAPDLFEKFVKPNLTFNYTAEAVEHYTFITSRHDRGSSLPANDEARRDSFKKIIKEIAQKLK